MKYGVLFDHSSDNNIGYVASNVSFEEACDVVERNKILATQYYGDDDHVTISMRKHNGTVVMLQVVGLSWCYSLSVVPHNPFHVGH